MVTVRAEIDAQEWTRILATVEKSSNDKSMNESLANTVGPEANTLGKVEQETTKGRGIETTKGGITERPTVRSKVVLLMHVSPPQRQGFFCPLVPSGQFVARLSDLARVAYDIWDKNNENSGINWLSLEPRRCSWRNSLRNLNGDQVIKTRPSRFEHCSRISEKERSDGE